MTHHSFAAHPFRPALPGERQPKFSYVLLLSPCFFDSFLEVTEVGAASFHLPQTETCSEKRKKKLHELNRGKDIQVKTEGSCKKVKEKEAREKASDNTRRFPSRSLTASTALSATLMPHAPPHALCEADLGAPTPPVAPPAPSQAALPLRGDRPSASRRPCSATSLHGRCFVASGCRR